MTAWTTVAALALLLCLAAALAAAGRGPRLRRLRGYEAIQPSAAPPPAAKKPTPDRGGPTAAPPAAESELAPLLARALDRALPSAPGQPVAWTHDEVRQLAAAVVQRINTRTPGLGLALVSFDRVTKLADVRGTTTRYAFDAHLHSAPRNLSTRATIKVDVDQGGRQYIRDIAVHGAAADTSAVRGSGGLADDVGYAAYEPVVRYDPQPV